MAVEHLARIIREDDGTDDLAGDFGNLPYSVALTGEDPSIPPEFLFPRDFRVDVTMASDTEILLAVARLVGGFGTWHEGSGRLELIMESHRANPCSTGLGRWRALVSIGLVAVFLTAGLGVSLHHHGGTSDHPTCALCSVNHTPILVGVTADFVISLVRLGPRINSHLEESPLDPCPTHISSRAPPVLASW